MHLEVVARRLADTEVSALTSELRRARVQNIDRLRAYARAGIFPRKPASIPGRVPNFVDDRGVVCAVGYLLEQDCGHAAAVDVAREHQFDYVPYIDSPVLVAWQATSGFTVTELAMIQPEYGDGVEPEIEEGWPDDEAVAAVLIFTNLAASIINFDHAASGKGSLAMGFVGLALGGATLAIGNADDRAALSASGALSGFFGLASFVVGLAHAASEPGTVSAQPFVGEIAGEQCDIGVLASVRF